MIEIFHQSGQFGFAGEADAVIPQGNQHFRGEGTGVDIRVTKDFQENISGVLVFHGFLGGGSAACIAGDRLHAVHEEINLGFEGLCRFGGKAKGYRPLGEVDGKRYGQNFLPTFP